MIHASNDDNIYANFCLTSVWDNHLNIIKDIDPDVAEAISKYGIGTKVCEDGDYDFESGQLLDDIPRSIKLDIEDSLYNSSYDSICDLAKAYARYYSEHAE